jgi:hypothetical protein
LEVEIGPNPVSKYQQYRGPTTNKSGCLPKGEDIRDHGVVEDPEIDENITKIAGHIKDNLRELKQRHNGLLECFPFINNIGLIHLHLLEAALNEYNADKSGPQQDTNVFSENVLMHLGKANELMGQLTDTIIQGWVTHFGIVESVANDNSRGGKLDQLITALFSEYPQLKNNLKDIFGGQSGGSDPDDSPSDPVFGPEDKSFSPGPEEKPSGGQIGSELEIFEQYELPDIFNFLYEDDMKVNKRGELNEIDDEAETYYLAQYLYGIPIHTTEHITKPGTIEELKVIYDKFKVLTSLIVPYKSSRSRKKTKMKPWHKKVQHLQWKSKNKPTKKPTKKPKSDVTKPKKKKDKKSKKKSSKVTIDLSGVRELVS